MTKTKFKLYKKGEETRVRFPECIESGKMVDYCTNVDKDGHIYFSIPYPYKREEGEKCIDKFFFYGGDSAGASVKSVFDGYADALQQGKTIFGMTSLEPVLFADRKYGELMRKRTMEGWKNATWKYGIRFQGHGSWGLGPVITEGMKHDSNPILFCTRKEAIEERDRLQDHINNVAREYRSVDRTDNSNAGKEFLDKLEKEDKLYELVLQALINTDEKNGGNPKKNYSLDICQVILK